MNSWIILLFLLLGNRNGRDNNDDYGCSRGSNGPQTRNFPGERNWNGDPDDECGCDGDNNRGRNRDFDRNGDFNRGRNFDDDEDCGCNNESRFEARFDSRSYDNSGCGCDNQ